MGTSTKKKSEQKKEFKMEQVLAMWKKTAKSGKDYFSGQNNEKEYFVGYYNGQKKNPKEPDVRIYRVDDEGSIEKEEYLSLWCNVSKSGKKFLTGKLDGERVVGFINTSGNEKQPYFSIYYSRDKEDSKKDSKGSEFVDASTDSDLPF